jgi:hypothetical protein
VFRQQPARVELERRPASSYHVARVALRVSPVSRELIVLIEYRKDDHVRAPMTWATWASVQLQESLYIYA